MSMSVSRAASFVNVSKESGIPPRLPCLPIHHLPDECMEEIAGYILPSDITRLASIHRGMSSVLDDVPSSLKPCIYQAHELQQCKANLAIEGRVPPRLYTWLSKGNIGEKIVKNLVASVMTGALGWLIANLAAPVLPLSAVVHVFSFISGYPLSLLADRIYNLYRNKSMKNFSHLSDAFVNRLAQRQGSASRELKSCKNHLVDRIKNQLQALPRHNPHNLPFHPSNPHFRSHFLLIEASRQLIEEKMIRKGMKRIVREDWCSQINNLVTAGFAKELEKEQSRDQQELQEQQLQEEPPQEGLFAEQQLQEPAPPPLPV